jgi:hypothetical protein
MSKQFIFSDKNMRKKQVYFKTVSKNVNVHPGVSCSKDGRVRVVANYSPRGNMVFNGHGYEANVQPPLKYA